MSRASPHRRFSGRTNGSNRSETLSVSQDSSHPQTLAIIVMPPLKEGGARLTAINHANALVTKRGVHKVLLLVTASHPRRAIVEELISKHVGKLFADKVSTTTELVRKCLQLVTTDVNQVLFHSHGMSADKLLTEMTEQVVRQTRRRRLRVCLAATQHGEVEQMLRRVDVNESDEEARSVFSYFETMIRTRDVLFYVARKNLTPYEHARYRDICRQSGALQKNFKVMNGVATASNCAKTLSQLGLSVAPTYVTFIVASRADDECKGHVLVTQAIQDCNAELRKRSVHRAQLLLLGDGAQLERVQKLMARKQVRDVACLGHVRIAQAYMWLAHFHVLASTCAEESAPICIADAHRKRVPSVVTDVGDCRELMQGAGFVVEGAGDAPVLREELTNTLLKAVQCVVDPLYEGISYEAMRAKCSWYDARNHSLSAMRDNYWARYTFKPR